MKLKRSDIKALVKECLMEILSEEFIASAVKARVNEVIVKDVPRSKRFTHSEQPKHTVQEEASFDLSQHPAWQQAATPAQTQKHAQNENDWHERFEKYQQSIRGGAKKQQTSVADTLNVADPVMRMIFEDTERTTVREQAAVGDTGKQTGQVNPGVPGLDQDGLDITKMFNPKWSDLAGL